MAITGTKTAERPSGVRPTAQQVQRAVCGGVLLLYAAAAAAQVQPSGTSEGRSSSAAPSQPATPAPAPRGAANRAARPGQQPAASRSLQFVPQISVGVAQTDNLTLVSSDPEAQTVLELIPSFTLTQNAPRFTANAAYRLEGYRYQQRQDSQVANTFDGAFSIALQPNDFFFDFGASRTQSVRDPAAPIPRSNLPISSNLINRDEYYGGPRLQYLIGSNVTARANYRHSWVRYKQGPFTQTPFSVDLENSTSGFSLDNYRKQRGFTWAASYNSSSSDYQIYPSFKYRRAGAELGFWAGRRVRLFATGGRESPWNKPADSSLSDRFWEAGFALQGGPRFNAELAAGERTFGASRRGSLSYTLRHGRTSLSYVETPTTTGLSRYSSGGLLQPTEPNDYLTRPGSAERYISKRLDWSWSMDLRRTGFSVAVFDESRKQRTRADGTPLPDQMQSGADLSVSWRAGPRTQFVLQGSRVRSEFTVGDRRDYTEESLTANRSVGGRTRVSFEYAHSAESSPTGTAGFNYTANLFSVLLTRTFSGLPNASGTTR